MTKEQEQELVIVIQDVYTGYTQHRIFDNMDIHESVIEDNYDYEKINERFHFNLPCTSRGEIVYHTRRYGRRPKINYARALDELLND